jgi:hypothetical protein
MATIGKAAKVTLVSLITAAIITGCNPKDSTPVATTTPDLTTLITTTAITTVPPTTTTAAPTTTPYTPKTTTPEITTPAPTTYTPPTAPAGYEQPVTGQITLSTKTVNISVLALAGETQKAQHVIDIYSKALPALEDLIGVPFPPNYAIEVREYKRADIGGVAGRNQGQKGLQIADTNMSYDPTLLHELAHYWFVTPQYSEKWLMEGFAMLYADQVLIKLGAPSIAADYKANRTSDYQKFLSTITISLSEWRSQTGDVSSFANAKAAVFLFSLYDKAGSDAFKEINRYAFKSRLGSSDFLPTLSKASGQDFSYLSEGWIYPGVPQPIR